MAQKKHWEDMRNVNQEIQSYGDIMSRYGIIIHSELAHHGIKGQKWGVRRYENPDGTLTEAGKERYGYRRAKKLHAYNRVSSIAGSAAALGLSGAGIAFAPETAGLSIPIGIASAVGIGAATHAISQLHDKKISEIINKSDKETFGKINKDSKLQEWYGDVIAQRKERERGQKNMEEFRNSKFYKQMRKEAFSKALEDLKKDDTVYYEELQNKGRKLTYDNIDDWLDVEPSMYPDIEDKYYNKWESSKRNKAIHYHKK